MKASHSLNSGPRFGALMRFKGSQGGKGGDGG
jgi:hypothetical protein